MSLEEVKAQFSKEAELFNSFVKEINVNRQQRQTLVQQSSENELVLEELNRLDEDAKVYKMIGPALIRQDLVEAKANVSKRLEYIKGELERLDNHVRSLDSKKSEKQKELQALQKRVQALQGPTS